MEGYSSPPPSRGSHAAIEHLLRTDAPFAQIEGAIERMDLTPDEKAALWMLAWSSSEGGVTRNAELERRLAPAG